MWDHQITLIRKYSWIRLQTGESEARVMPMNIHCMTEKYSTLFSFLSKIIISLFCMMAVCLAVCNIIMRNEVLSLWMGLKFGSYDLSHKLKLVFMGLVSHGDLHVLAETCLLYADVYHLSKIKFVIISWNCFCRNIRTILGLTLFDDGQRHQVSETY